MPFKEQPSSRILHNPDGSWSCAHCGYSSDRYQPIVGHLGKHTEGRRPTGRPKGYGDPLNMSISELIDVLDALRKEVSELRDQLHKEQKKNVDIRHALNAFMQ